MKTPLTTLPADAFVVAALDELITDTQSLLDAAARSKPTDKDEVAFWRKQRNAYVNAQGDWADGLRPHLTPNGYLLRSASHPGETHRAWQVGSIWTCSCRAGELGIFHRHTALISALERAAEMESEAQKDAEISGGGSDETGSDNDLPVSCSLSPVPSQGNPIPHAAEAAAWVGAQIALSQRIDATAALLDAMRAAQACDPPGEGPSLGDDEGDTLPSRRHLGLRLVHARKHSAYFASAFYLEAA